MKTPRVLIVDDEKNIRDLLEAGLKFAGFSVYSVGTGAEAVSVAEKSKPDILVLVFLSARDDRSDKVTGLTVGGDDYMTKPFSIDEVIARINAILRRTKKRETEDSILEVGEIRINQDAHEVFVNGKEIELSPTEYKLLRFLMTNANRVMSKDQILDHVWEYDFNGEQGIVESYVSYLRKKIDPLSKNQLIQTKRGVGYMFRTYKND